MHSMCRAASPRGRLLLLGRGRVAGRKLHLVGQREAGPVPSFAERADEVAEAAGVAAKILSLIESGTPASEIAVLYRINAQSEAYEEALTEAGIPFQVRGGEGFFTRQEIRQALLDLHRQIVEPDPSLPRKSSDAQSDLFDGRLA